MIMPTGFYDIMTDRDLDAVIAYLRTLKPVNNKVCRSGLQNAAGRARDPGRRQAVHRRNDERQGQEGFLSHDHRALHGMPYADGERRTPVGHTPGAGGFEFPGPWGVSVSRNITSSKTKGIGAWTDDEIKRAITAGVDREGKQAQAADGLPILCDADARRSGCHRGLSADRTGGRIGFWGRHAQGEPICAGGLYAGRSSRPMTAPWCRGTAFI